MIKDVATTLGNLIVELDKMGIACFPAKDLAMALPAYLFEIARATPLDYSKPSRKGVATKVEHSPMDQAMAVLSSLAYLNGDEGQIQKMLFDSNTIHEFLGKNPGAALSARGITLSAASFAQIKPYKSDKGKPCWFSVADENKQVIYVVIRGTQDPADVLSDLNIQTKDVTILGQTAKVHSGISDSAQFVIENSKAHVAPYLEKGFSLVFTGHSLGAGTAALAAAYSRTSGDKGYKDATAVTFACPGIVAARDANGSKSAASHLMKKFVTTYILGFDVVPRASGVAVFKLLDNIFSLDWKAKFKQMMEEEAKKKTWSCCGISRWPHGQSAAESASTKR